MISVTEICKLLIEKDEKIKSIEEYLKQSAPNVQNFNGEETKRYTEALLAHSMLVGYRKAIKDIMEMPED